MSLYSALSGHLYWNISFFTGLPANKDFVTISKAGSFAHLLEDSDVYEKFCEVVQNSNSREYPMLEVSRLEKSNSSINHWLCIWLAERAESASNAVSWEDFADMMISVGVDSEAFDGVFRNKASVHSASQSSSKNTLLHQNIQTKGKNSCMISFDLSICVYTISGQTRLTS